MAKTTITVLSRKLGVSVCTVNKALTGRARISEKTRLRVLKAAKRLGYRPNPLAQALARNTLRIAVLYPPAWPSYYEPLIEGVRLGLAELEDHNVSAGFHKIRDWTAKGMRNLEKFDPNGVVACLGPESGQSPLWNELSCRRVPVIFLGTDVPGQPRLCAVRQDGVRSGRMAAELLADLTSKGSVAVIIGCREILDHRDKVDGFMEQAKHEGLAVAGVYEAHDDPALAYSVTRDIFSKHRNIRGLYVATDNSEGVCRYLRKHGLAGRVKVVATGIFPALRRSLDRGEIQFTLFQRMPEQGRLAVHTLYHQLIKRAMSPNEMFVPPLVVVKNNVDVCQHPLVAP